MLLLIQLDINEIKKFLKLFFLNALIKYINIGFWLIGIRGFGITKLKGLNLFPFPPASMTILVFELIISN